MARNEQDREDLIREATALIRRLEFSINQDEELIFAGYKRSGNLSVYLNPDLVYHFDELCRLRRAFIAPYLYRSGGKSLTRLERVRTELTSELHSTELPAEELDQFLKEMLEHLINLKDALNSSQVKIQKQIPEDVDLIQELTGSLNQVINQKGILSPAIVKR